MRFKRFMGGLLFGLGCVVVLVGLLAAVLPLFENEQLRLVLSSFQAPSANPAVNAVNVAMRYAMANCYLVVLYGAVLVIVGLLLFTGKREPKEAAPAQPSAYTVATDDAPVPDPPVWGLAEREAPNPFADASVASMLAPKQAETAVAYAQAAPPPPSAYRRPEATQPEIEPETPRAAVPAYVPPKADRPPNDEAQGTLADDWQAILARVREGDEGPKPSRPEAAPPKPAPPQPEVIYRSPSLQPAQAEAPQAAETPAPSPRQPASSRIRSTMGVHH